MCRSFKIRQMLLLDLVGFLPNICLYYVFSKMHAVKVQLSTKFIKGKSFTLLQSWTTTGFIGCRVSKSNQHQKPHNLKCSEHPIESFAYLWNFANVFLELAIKCVGFLLAELQSLPQSMFTTNSHYSLTDNAEFSIPESHSW